MAFRDRVNDGIANEIGNEAALFTLLLHVFPHSSNTMPPSDPFAWTTRPEVLTRKEPLQTYYKTNEMTLSRKIELARDYATSQVLKEEKEEAEPRARDLPPPGNIQNLERLAKPFKRHENVKFTKRQQEEAQKQHPAPGPVNTQVYDRLAQPRNPRPKWQEPPRPTYDHATGPVPNEQTLSRLTQLPEYRKHYAVKFDGKDPLALENQAAKK